MDAHDLPDDPVDLVALYAAGALAGEDRVQFEAHLASGCARCREELAQLAPVVAALANAVAPVPPPARVREVLLARVAGGSSPPPAAGVDLFIRRSSEGDWRATPIPGVWLKLLFADRQGGRYTALVRMEAGKRFPEHVHGGLEESFVLEGDLRLGTTVLRPGDYQRAAAGSRHPAQTTEDGCLLLVTGALADLSR